MSYNYSAADVKGLVGSVAGNAVNMRVDDGLKWGNSKGSTGNKAAYTAEMTEMVKTLANANRNLGILHGGYGRIIIGILGILGILGIFKILGILGILGYLGILNGGYGDSWRAPRHVHVYWAYGVGDHTNVHTSLAFVYKSDHSTQDRYVMIKVDLQAGVPNSARDNEDSAGGNADMAWKGGDIYILHEIKVVDGINRKVWREKKGVYKMSMEDVVAVLHTVVNKTDPIYSIFSNNCIGYDTFDFLDLDLYFLGSRTRSLRTQACPVSWTQLKASQTFQKRIRWRTLGLREWR